MLWVNLLVLAAILLGLVGIVVPILPGTILIAAALIGWAIAQGGTTAWSLAILAVAVLAAGSVVKFVVPGRRLAEAGIPSSTQWWGVAAAVAGFFVIPIVGFFVGFVLGVYLAEARRLGTDRAWPSTWAALKAAGLSIVIEFAAALLASTLWVVGVVVA